MLGNPKTRSLRLRDPRTTVAAAASSILLGSGLAFIPDASAANQNERRMGDAFLSAFAFSGLGSEWWASEFDQPSERFLTGWRTSAVTVDDAGVRINLAPGNTENLAWAATDDDGAEARPPSDKSFVSGQLRRRKWYGYGNYQIVMKPAEGDGLINAFYVYTGGNNIHEEIEVEVLGRTPNAVNFRRFHDGKPLSEPVSIDLEQAQNNTPRLYAFDWSAEALTLSVDGQEVFRITDAAEIPVPPARIFIDLRTARPRQAETAGDVQPDTSGEMLVQCVSYAFPDTSTVQCSDLMPGRS